MQGWVGSCAEGLPDRGHAAKVSVMVAGHPVCALEGSLHAHLPAGVARGPGKVSG